MSTAEELEAILGPHIAAKIAEQGGGETWQLDKWVIVADLIRPEDNTRMIVYNSAPGMVGWMERGLLNEGKRYTYGDEQGDD